MLHDSRSRANANTAAAVVNDNNSWTMLGRKEVIGKGSNIDCSERVDWQVQAFHTIFATNPNTADVSVLFAIRAHARSEDCVCVSVHRERETEQRQRSRQRGHRAQLMRHDGSTFSAP